MSTTQTARTPSQTLASVLLGEDVMVWLDRTHAKVGSWHAAAAELATATNGLVKVTPRALDYWRAAEKTAA